jgi:hypothetical protein
MFSRMSKKHRLKEKKKLGYLGGVLAVKRVVDLFQERPPENNALLVAALEVGLLPRVTQMIQVSKNNAIPIIYDEDLRSLKREMDISPLCSIHSCTA